MIILLAEFQRGRERAYLFAMRSEEVHAKIALDPTMRFLLSPSDSKKGQRRNKST